MNVNELAVTPVVKESINILMEKAIKRCPSEKVVNTNNLDKRDDEFCVFILSYGRAEDVRTAKTLLKDGGSFSQDYYIVCSDDDKSLDTYIKNYGDRVLVFNKDEMAPYTDTGDNFDKRNVVIFARNICFSFAKKLGYRYFVQFDDDYHKFMNRYIYDNKMLVHSDITDFDKMLKVHLDFLKNTPCTIVAMAQGGDFIGGAGNGNALKGYKRKVMNSFFCDLERPFYFYGTMNEDATYYAHASRMGILVMTLYGWMLDQASTQANSGGLTDIYLESGTYLKSFYSVMYSPSNTKIGKLGSGAGERIHHNINGRAAFPEIIDEKYAKKTYTEIQRENSVE